MSITRPRILPPSAPQPAMRFAGYDQDTLRRAMKAAARAEGHAPPIRKAAPVVFARPTIVSRKRQSLSADNLANMALMLGQLRAFGGEGKIAQIRAALGFAKNRTWVLMQYLVADGDVEELRVGTRGYLYRVTQ